MIVAMALAAGVGCKGSGKVVNYNLPMTHAPMCPAGARTGNHLKRTLIVRTETSVGNFTQFGYSGTNFGDSVQPVSGMVMLAKEGGKQTVKVRFGACPSREPPAGTAADLGCPDTEIAWYTEQSVTLDPQDLVIYGESGTPRTSVEWPWPSAELVCWTGVATAAPNPS